MCGDLVAKQEAEEAQMRKAGYMDCPVCGTWAVRTEGCARVICKNRDCGAAYNAHTGRLWTAKEANDQAAHGRGHHRADYTEEQARAMVKKTKGYDDSKAGIW
jgi:hypothetical protein